MTKFDDYTVENIPEWAVVYLEYGEGDYDDEDIELMNSWIDTMQECGYDMGCIDYIDEEPSFTSCPAFGLPCDCYKARIYRN